MTPSTASSPAITPDQRRQLLIDFAGKRVDYPRDRTVIDLLEEQVSRTPDRKALIWRGHELSYRELDGKANTLAAELRALGVGKGDVVPVWTTKSPAFAISTIALMKRGAAFVPVDVDWPVERIRAILKSLQPKVVLADEPKAAAVESPAGIRIVMTDALAVSGSTGRDPLEAQDPIYGFYTSGSTGMPKCAINLHRGLVNRFCYMTRRFGIREDDVVLQNSRNAFDSSMWQLFWPLLNGARVAIPPSRERYDLMETIDIIHEYGVTMTDLVPSIFNVLVDYLKTNPQARRRLRSLRQVLVGGEEMNAHATYEFRSMLPHVGITNTYGPTETSIGVVFYEVGDERHDRMPIGKPIDNVCALILDENMDLVPVGTTGEIYIGGDCMGRGYLNDEERTRAVFVANPFPEVPGDRLYRTGDFAYHYPDGNIQFVGRRDQQVQLSGVRVELGEIECALLRCPGVKEAKVLLAASAAGREELAAFVVPLDDFHVAAARDRLRESLSEYMIPRRFEVLPAMPLNHNGKVDRQALLRLLEERVVAAAPDADDSAETPEQKAVLEICRELFGADAVRASRSFIELGGDSLLAIQLVSRVRKACGISLSLEQIFGQPDLRSLGRALAGTRGRRTAADREKGEDLRLADDLILNDSIRRDPSESDGCGFRHVLLTGATGFVGAHLLDQILRVTEAAVYCLVRAPDERTARQRICENLARYRLDAADPGGRIIPVPGDLSQPGLGIAPDRYEVLAGQIDSVIHNGAMVNFARSYDEHRPSNIAGTVEILRFAGAGRRKGVHYVSTLSVLPQSEADLPGPAPGEDAPLERQRLPRDGYSRSKWVAESLVETARSRGIPASVYRLGEVMPHARHGVPNARAFSHLLIKGCLALGVYPQSRAEIDYSPADYVSGAIVHIARRMEGRGSTFHVCHPTGIPLGQLMRMWSSFGHTLVEVSYHEFWRRLASASADAKAGNELASLMFLLDQAVEADGEGGDGAAADVLSACFAVLPDRSRHRRTACVLEGSSIRCPDIDPEVLRPYAAYCMGRP
jgi:amino acid adenylation domain-containing protein/thioester reductase-like protein